MNAAAAAPFISIPVRNSISSAARITHHANTGQNEITGARLLLQNGYTTQMAAAPAAMARADLPSRDSASRDGRTATRMVPHAMSAPARPVPCAQSR
jgi:hypothetical protein